MFKNHKFRQFFSFQFHFCILIFTIYLQHLNTHKIRTHKMTNTLTLKQNFTRDYTFVVIHILKNTYFLIFISVNIFVVTLNIKSEIYSCKFFILCKLLNLCVIISTKSYKIRKKHLLNVFLYIINPFLLYCEQDYIK